MQKIEIKCKGYHTMNISKHSELEIQRIADSILNDGFLFPIMISEVNSINYIIDGECTYMALQELKYRNYDIPEIPICYIESDEETIKKIILIATSTNHCVTKYSLEYFVNGSNIDLKELSFNEGALIDFYTRDYFDDLFSKYKTDKLITKKYEVEIIGGLI